MFLASIYPSYLEGFHAWQKNNYSSALFSVRGSKMMRRYCGKGEYVRRNVTTIQVRAYLTIDISHGDFLSVHSPYLE